VAYPGERGNWASGIRRMPNRPEKIDRQIFSDVELAQSSKVQLAHRNSRF
jgi:hypothetical protein